MFLGASSEKGWSVEQSVAISCLSPCFETALLRILAMGHPARGWGSGGVVGEWWGSGGGVVGEWGGEWGGVGGEWGGGSGGGVGGE